MTWSRLPRKINRAKGQGVLLAEGATSRCSKSAKYARMG
jgi:hypothetical protein